MPQTTLWRIRYEPTATRIFSSKQRVFAAPHRKQHNAASVSTVCARAMPRGGAVPGFRAGWYRGRQQPGDALQEPRGRNRIELLSPALTLAARKRCATLYHNPGAMPFFSPLTNLLFDSPFRRRAVARSCKRPRRCFLGPSWPALHPRRSTCVAGEQAMCCASHKVCEPCLRETAPPRQRTCAFRGGSLRAQATSKSS